MPGKYLEFIRAGRYVVPVELTFLPISYTEKVSGKCITTSKWMEKHHWKEIKAMLKPGVEMITKHNNETGAEKISKSPHVSFGQEISLGYIIQPNKDKSPFIAVLDPKQNCWTDDEEDLEVDENIDIADFGGRYQNLIPTNFYIKASTIKKSSSESEDALKIKRELGLKNDDLRNYLQVSNPPAAADDSSKDSSSVASSREKTKSSRSKRDARRHGNKSIQQEEDDKSSDEISTTTETETESLMDLPPPTGRRDATPLLVLATPKLISPVTINLNSFSSLRPTNFISRQEEPVDETSLRRLYRQCSPPDDMFCGRLFRNWEDGDEDSGDEELPDIEEFSAIVTNKGRRSKKTTGSPRKRTPGDRSPTKHRCIETGLPDIDEGVKGPKGPKPPKKKRTVAIVEPMKPMSFEEAIGGVFQSAERKRKGRNMASPTLDRGFGSGRNTRNTTSAIEILQEDSELLPIPGYTPQGPSHVEKKKKAEGEKPQRKRRKKKIPVDKSLYSRLTPSPFPESPEEPQVHNPDSDQDTSESSELEMPVLDKMVSTSDEEQREKEIIDCVEELRSLVPSLEREISTNETQNSVTVNTSLMTNEDQTHLQGDTDLLVPPYHTEQSHNSSVSDTENMAESESEKGNNDQRQKKRLKRKNKTKSQEHENETIETSSNNEVVSLKVNTTVVNDQNTSNPEQRINIPKARKRYASDSDDITSEAAYRKKPLKKKKRRQKMSTPNTPPTTPLLLQNTIKESLSNTSTFITQSNSNSVSLMMLENLQESQVATGDAQTQTFLPLHIVEVAEESCSSGASVLVNVPEDDREEPEDEETFVITKDEKFDCNQSFDSDYAAGAFSDGEDDDVVYEGEFISNLYLPALGSPEEGIECLDLFSFENPVPNPLYRPPITPDLLNIPSNYPENYRDGALSPTPMVPLLVSDSGNDHSYSAPAIFEPRQESDDPIITEILKDSGVGYSFDLAANMDKRYFNPNRPIPDPNLRRALQIHSSDDSDEQDEVVIQSTPKNLSVFELMTHPNTLKGSFGLFDQIEGNETSKKVSKVLKSKGKSKIKESTFEQEEDNEKDKELMPPPILRRPSSPDICSLNPEERIKRPKLKKQRSLQRNQSNQNQRSQSPQPGPSSGVINRQTRLQNDEDYYSDDCCGETEAEPFFNAFVSRIDAIGGINNQIEYEPYGDEFDLSQRSHCMLNVIPNYIEKSRLYKIHSKNIRDLKIPELMEEFERIRPEIRGIFEGTYPSERNALYCSKNQREQKTLRDLNIQKPFTNEQGRALSSFLNDYLVPQTASRIRYVDYINFVMLPETYIRIYSHINNISHEMAEVELKYGACHEYPMDI